MSAVQDAHGMFHKAAAFNQDIGRIPSTKCMHVVLFKLLYLGRWDMSGVKSAVGMFKDAAAFDQDINKWNVQSVTTMQSM